ncbi:MAG: hypothetical protein HLUCCA12_00565 [Rhodobacteraceae bacterium HLUCCA12]|nr:MAG: hypothetical protein HLUCCA12_00565 [Rhodobacteraceae bacterium HLUCCA12]
MIDALKTLFAPRPAATDREIEPDLAVATLLVEAACADGTFDDDERHAVDALLSDMFDLPDPAPLRQRAEAAQAQAADLVRFTRVVKALSHDQRIALIEALWQVVLVDHHRDPHEDALLRHLAPLLGLDDRESAEARLRVMARAGQAG